jgi:lipopolysaccharide export system ATP-binding protein
VRPRCHDRPAEGCVRSSQALRARALAFPKIARSPRYVLLDEPFSGIDPIADLQGEIRSLRDKGVGVIITDHNVRDTLSITDFAHLIDRGRLVTSGTPAEIVADPTVRRVYLGETFQP